MSSRNIQIEQSGDAKNLSSSTYGTLLSPPRNESSRSDFKHTGEAKSSQTRQNVESSPIETSSMANFLATHYRRLSHAINNNDILRMFFNFIPAIVAAALVVFPAVDLTIGGGIATEAAHSFIILGVWILVTNIVSIAEIEVGEKSKFAELFRLAWEVEELLPPSNMHLFHLGEEQKIIVLQFFDALRLDYGSNNSPIRVDGRMLHRVASASYLTEEDQEALREIILAVGRHVGPSTWKERNPRMRRYGTAILGILSSMALIVAVISMLNIDGLGARLQQRILEDIGTSGADRVGNIQQALQMTQLILTMFCFTGMVGLQTSLRWSISSPLVTSSENFRNTYHSLRGRLHRFKVTLNDANYRITAPLDLYLPAEEKRRAPQPISPVAEPSSLQALWTGFRTTLHSITIEEWRDYDGSYVPLPFASYGSVLEQWQEQEVEVEKILLPPPPARGATLQQLLLEMRRPGFLGEWLRQPANRVLTLMLLILTAVCALGLAPTGARAPYASSGLLTGILVIAWLSPLAYRLWNTVTERVERFAYMHDPSLQVDGLVDGFSPRSLPEAPDEGKGQVARTQQGEYEEYEYNPLLSPTGSVRHRSPRSDIGSPPYQEEVESPTRFSPSRPRPVVPAFHTRTFQPPTDTKLGRRPASFVSHPAESPSPTELPWKMAEEEENRLAVEPDELGHAL